MYSYFPEARAAIISAPSQYWLYTDNTGANTTIDADHTTSWVLTIDPSASSVPLYGGNFAIKTGGAPTDDIYLDLYACAYKCGSPVATATVSRSAVTGTYTSTSFAFSSAYMMAAGHSYFAVLHSATSTSGNGQYFFKYNGSASVTDGVTLAPGASVTSNASTPQIVLSKTSSASGPIPVNSTFSYTIC